MHKQPSFCIAGASGLVGRDLLAILSQVEDVTDIKAISRSPLGKLASNTDNIILNFDKLNEHTESLKADVFLCCLGTTIKTAGSQEAFRKVDFDYVVNFAKIAEHVGAKKLLVVSAMGANSESSIFYNRVKGETEEALYDLNIPQIEIFRPSLLLGDRKEARTGEKIAQKLSPLMNALMVGPLKKYRAIEAMTVAKAMTIAALNFHEGRYIYESDEIQRIADAI